MVLLKATRYGLSRKIEPLYGKATEGSDGSDHSERTKINTTNTN